MERIRFFRFPVNIFSISLENEANCKKTEGFRRRTAILFIRFMYDSKAEFVLAAFSDCTEAAPHVLNRTKPHIYIYHKAYPFPYSVFLKIWYNV